MALSFNGTTSKIVGSNSTAFNFQNTTFCVAVRFRSSSTAQGAFVSKGGAPTGSGTKGYAMALNSSGTGKIRLFVKTGDESSGALCLDVLSGGSSYNNGSWHSVVFQATTSSSSSAGNTGSIYADGAYDGTTNTASGVYEAVPTANVAIGVRGADLAPQTFFTGDIADVGIWSASLTDAEKAAYCKGFTGDRIRLQSLVFYAPCVRDITESKGMALTATAITATTHPRVIG